MPQPSETTRRRRLDAAGRLAGVDLARGLAVVGMFAAHLLWIEAWDWGRPETWADIANGRPSILFATLAGLSIGLVSGGRRPVTGEKLAAVRGRLAVRAGLIWVIGVLLILTGVPVYVILPAYAILFALALPALPLTARPLLIIAAALAVALPFVQVILDALPFWQTLGGELVALIVGWHYPFTTWVAFVLCGLGLGRLDLTALRVQVWLVVGGAVPAAVAYGLAARAGEPAASDFWADVWTAEAHSTGVLEVVGSGGFAVAVIGVCLLLCRTPVRWAVWPLRAMGAMPLTAYVLQLVVWALWAGVALGDPGDLAGFRDLSPFWALTLGTMAFCMLWTLAVGRGPLEWCVARVSALAAPPPR